MKKLIIFLSIVFFLFLSAFAIADEKETAKELKNAKQAGQIREHEKNIQNKIDIANAEITEILSSEEKILDKDFETVEKKQKEIKKYKKQLGILKSERVELEKQYRDPLELVKKDIEKMKQKKMSPFAREWVDDLTQ